MINKIKQNGFTLIELLVVVTLISILAVAVLATINPIEQRRKAQDTGAKSAAAELTGALERYFVTHGCYPWDSDDPGIPNCANPDGASPGTTPILVSTASNNLDLLVSTGEVKKQLLDRIPTYNGSDANNPYATIVISESEPDDSITVCFNPVSNSFQSEADAAGYGQDGGVAGGTCVTGGGNGINDCHVCVPEL